jgi:hypothetical protein
MNQIAATNGHQPMISQLSHDALGRLTLRLPNGELHSGVLPVRAFPLEAPDEGISLVSEHGRELFWLAHINDLPVQERGLLHAALGVRDFVPEIHRLLSVSTFSTPSVWVVETDRGLTQLVLKGEEDIRLLPGEGMRLLINSGHGVVFLIRDLHALDSKSKKLLERFL